MHPKTLAVVTANKNPYGALDVIAGLQWGCTQPAELVLVDTGQCIAKKPNNVTLLRSDPEGALPDFAANNAIIWAIEKGVEFQQVLLLSEDCIVTGKGVDAWALEHTAKHGVGLIGVADRYRYDDAYASCATFFAEHNMPHVDLGDLPQQTQVLLPSILYMSATLARTLYDNNVLCPEKCETWPLRQYGPFISWACMMYGYYAVGWGAADQHLPPLYHGIGTQQPPPYVLSPRFTVYAPVKSIAGHSEETIRETYKRHRGEPHTPVPPVRPQVFGKGVGNVPT